MHSKKQQLEESTAFLKNKGIQTPDFGIILGTGLGDLVQEMEIEIEIPYADIPHFPSSTMEFHQARLLYGMLSGRKVVVFEGRFHAYEGLSYFEITYPIRLMHTLGVKKVIISNAAGAINLDYKKGEVMLIEDHINLQAGSPLAEKGSESLGPRFVDMSSPYSPSLCLRIKEIAKEKAISLHSGSLCSRNRSTIGNQGRISLFAINWRRCGGHVHRSRGYCRQSTRDGMRSFFCAHR